MNGLVKEAMQTQQHLNNTNEKEGFKLSQAQNPTTEILQTNDTDSTNNIIQSRF